MRRLAPAAMALIFLLTAAPSAAQLATPPPEHVIHVTGATLFRMGVRVVHLEAAQTAMNATGYVRALDISQLAAIDAEITTARAAAAASAAETSRLSMLAGEDRAASVRSVEVARAQARADAARVILAERRIGLEFGPGLTRLGPRARAQLIAAASVGRAALVRVDFSDPAVTPGRRITLRVPRGPIIEASSLGMAAGADARLQSVGVLATVWGPGARSLPAGRVLQVEMETGPPEPGVIVPRAALVRYAGGVWAFVQTGPGVFARRAVVGARLLEAGWFVSAGFRPGDVVAVEGVGSLLALERGATAAAD